MDAPGVPRLTPSFPASAIFWAWVVEKEQPDYLCGPLWPVRLGVRTPGFHPGSRGSNPLRATSKKGTQVGAFFAFCLARKACFPGKVETQEKAAALGGGASRSLGKKPPPGFADRREAIPTRGMGELAHTEGRGNPRHAGKRNVWLQALRGVWQELRKIHGGG